MDTDLKPGDSAECVVLPPEQSGPAEHAQPPATCHPPQALHFITLQNRDHGGLKALTFGQVLVSGRLKLCQVNKIQLLDYGQCFGGADGQAGGNLYNDLKTHKAFWTSNISYKVPL